MFILCCIFVFLTILGIFLLGKGIEFGAILSCFFILAYFFSIFIWILCYVCHISTIQEFKATKLTIENASTFSEFERVQLTESIIKSNSWLAGCKYWNSTIFGDIIPNEIEELEFIK
jgi:hypothetical protein